jgi:hypothetical protein
MQAAEEETEARAMLTRHVAGLQQLHIDLAGASRSLKHFSEDGAGLAEIRLAYEMLEQYLAITDAFLENMRARFDARLGVLKRAEPHDEFKPGHPEREPGNTEFWLEFSRLSAVLRRVARRSEL